MRFCFKLACGWGCLAAVALAAGPGAPPRTRPQPAEPAVLRSVVRADPRSGRLVRAVVAPVATRPIPAAHPAAEPLRQTVERIAARESLPPELIHSVIRVESNYNPFAISPKGALGLMQLIPATARRFGVADVFDPAENIQGGARYLRHLLDLYSGNYNLALAAYNAGEGAVARYGAVPPFHETRAYVTLVGRQMAALTQAAREKTEPAKPPQAAARDERPAGPAHIQAVVETDGSVRYVSQ